MNVQRIEEMMAGLLILGTLTSLTIVAVGGVLFLKETGHSQMQFAWLQADTTQQTIAEIWRFAFSFTPLGIIQLGLLVLVATQSIRVLLLCWYYASIRDYRFFFICAAILLVLVYSSFWRT